MKKEQPDVCAYCLEADPETRDHIPPKSFFPKPLPSNLITVPCCERCRKSQSLDDEYFRLAIVSSSNCSEHPEARAVNDAILRSFQKPTKAAFATFVNESLIELDVQTPAGLYVGRTGGLKLEPKRIQQVAERIVRGLFFHELGRPVPKHYEVTNVIGQFGFQKASKVLSNLAFPPARVLGRDVFRYTFRATEEDPDSTVWLQSFYDGLPLMGFTRKPDPERAA